MQMLNSVGGQYLSGGWAHLEWGVFTGGPVFEKAYGEPFFDYCKSHPQIEENFSKAMIDLDHSCELPKICKWRSAAPKKRNGCLCIQADSVKYT